MSSSVTSPTSPKRIVLMGDAIVTFIMAVITFLALDDITTDTARSFLTERIALMVSTCWFMAVAWRIRGYGYRFLGLVSISVAVGTAVAQLTVGQGVTPGGSIAHITVLCGLIWLTALAGLLAWLAWRVPAPTLPHTPVP